MYDLAKDPQEMKNIYEDPSYSSKREQMHRLLEQMEEDFQISRLPSVARNRRSR